MTRSKTHLFSMECVPLKSPTMNPTNLAFLFMIVDAILAVIFLGYTWDYETFFGLAFFMTASYWGSFFITLVFHLSWITNKGPGSYWPNGPSYSAMFESYLGPFYLLQSGLYAPIVGLFYLCSKWDLAFTSWLIIGATFFAPAFNVIMLESVVFPKKTDTDIVV
jgi:hypothetical protein